MSEVVNETQEQNVTVLNEGSNDTTTPKKADKPTRDDLKAQGWSDTELSMAEKQGKVRKEVKEEEPEVEANAEAEPKKEEAPVKQEERRKEDRDKDYTHSHHLDSIDLTIEQEKELGRLFPPSADGTMHPVRALYRGQRKEREARQKIQAERDQLLSKLQELEQRVNVQAVQKAQPVIDENGNEIDPEDRPLTLKQWKEMQRQEAEEKARQEEEARRTGSQRYEAIMTQEEYARSLYPDYDEAITLVADITKNLENLDLTNWQRAKAKELLNVLHYKGQNATEYGVEDYNAALVAYELAKLHPNYGKQKPNGHRADPQNGNLDPNKGTGATHSPEQMKRIEANTQRRVSSASIPGGSGKRVVSVEDIGLLEYNSMSPAERLEFKTKHPKRHAELMRG